MLFNSNDFEVVAENKTTLADRNNNPGNLRYANQKDASQGVGGFAKFETSEKGSEALKNQIKLDSSRGHTLGSFIEKYAPPSENDTPAYVSFMEKEVGANANKPLSAIDVNKVSNAITKFEGGNKTQQRATFNPDDFEVIIGGPAMEPKKEPKSTTRVAVEALGRLPKNILNQVTGLVQGQEGASVADPGWFDRRYAKTEAENLAAAQEAEAGGGKFVPGISDKDVSETINQIPYTGLAVAGGLLGGSVTAPIPVPGARAGGALIGSHLATNRPSAYQAMHRNLQRFNDLNIQVTGKPITLEEENKFKEVYGKQVGEMADWESIPEAAGTLIDLAIYGIGAKLPAPLRAKAGEAVKALLKNKFLQGGFVNSTKLLGNLITELSEEVVSGIGGGNVEKEMWGEEKQDWDVKTAVKTAKEVAPQVALMVGGTHAVGTVAGKLSKEKKPTQAKDKKVFADQLDILSDELKKSNNKLADISTAIDLHSQLAKDPEKQAAVADVIAKAADQGLQDGTITADALSEITDKLSEDDPLKTALLPKTEPATSEVKPSAKPPVETKPVTIPGAEAVLKRMQEGKSIPEEKKLTDADRRQKRIDAAGEIERPSDVIGEYFPADQTATDKKTTPLVAKEKEQRTLEVIEKEITDRWKQRKSLPPGKKKSQIANEITALNSEMERTMDAADLEDRGGRVAQERGRVEKIAELAEMVKEPWKMSKEEFGGKGTNFLGGRKYAIDAYTEKIVNTGRTKQILNGPKHLYKKIKEVDGVVVLSSKDGVYLAKDYKEGNSNVEFEVVGRLTFTKEGIDHFALSPELRGKEYGQLLLKEAAVSGRDIAKAPMRSRGYNKALHKFFVKKAIEEGKIKSHPDYPELTVKKEAKKKPVAPKKAAKTIIDGIHELEPVENEEKFLKHNNSYLKMEVSDEGEILMGVPLEELKNPKALKSRLDDLYSDREGIIELGMDTKEEDEAIAFLEGKLKQIPPKSTKSEAPKLYILPKPLKEKVTYNGIREGSGKVPARHTFTDKNTGSTFLVDIDEADIKSKVNMRLSELDAEVKKKETPKVIEPKKETAAVPKETPTPETHTYTFRGKAQTIPKADIGKAFIKNKQRPIFSQRSITKGKNKGKIQVLYPSGKTNTEGAKIARSVIVDADAIVQAVGGESYRGDKQKSTKRIKDEKKQVEEAKKSYLSEPTGGAGLTEKKTGKPKWPKIVSNRRRRYLSHTTHIKNNGDAAAFADYNLSGFPQERLVALLLGKGGEVLGAHRFSVGTSNQASVSLGMLAGQALNTGGVKEVILVHNHPGGEARLSDADINTSNAFYNLLADTKIFAGTIIAVGEGTYSANDRIIHKTPTIKEATVRVPMMVRRFKTRGENLAVVSNSTSAKKHGGKLIPKGGLMFLNGANAIVGTMRIDNYSKLRGKNATKILEQIEETNATSMIAFNPTQNSKGIGAQNLKRFSSASGLNLLDIIAKEGSLQGEGSLPMADGSIYYETTKTKGKTLTTEDIQKTFAKMKNVTTGQDGNDNFWFRFKGFPRFSILELDSINNRVGLTDEQQKTGAFLPESKQIWFKTGGVGAKADIGSLHHENFHLFKNMGVVSKPDIRAINRAIRRSGHSGAITEETQASWIGNAAKSREYTRDTVIGRILQKIGDFIDAMINLVGVTSKNVVRKMESGRIADQAFDAGRGSTSPVMAFEQTAKRFYSQVVKTVETKMPKKMQASAVMNWLKKQPGIKAAELEWMNIKELLEGKKSVERNELVKALEENQVVVEEVEKGQTGYEYHVTGVNPLSKTFSFMPLKKFDTKEKAETHIKKIETAANLDDTLDKKRIRRPLTISKVATDNTKFSEYQLEGEKENYRELLFKLPATDGKFKSQHWDETNVFAHARINERTDADDNKVLFVEEIQSDWGKEGREKGYAPKVDFSKTEEKKRKYFRLKKRLKEKYGTEYKKLAQAKETDQLKKLKEYKKEHRILQGLEGVLDFPFKKNWQEVVLKRIVRMAADQGINNIAWVTGEQTSDRYDLSKHVDKIEYNGKKIYAFKNDKIIIEQTAKTQKELEALVGKDITKKLLEQQEKKPDIPAYVKDNDLKVGGEWAYNLYDKMIPQFLKKFGKKYKAQIGTTEINGIRQQSFTISPQLRQAALFEGIPLFETQDVNLSEEIEEEDTAFQQAIDLISAHWGKQGKYTNERKKLKFMEHHFGTTMYNAKRIGGWYNRFYNVIRNLGQYKFEQQNRLRGEGDSSLFTPLETFSKKNKTEYRKLRKYLVNKDIYAEGYKVRPTLEEGALYEGAYDIINEKGTVIDTQTTEDKAFDEVWEIEADATDFTDAGKEALLNFRKMTRNLYKHYAKGMNEIIEMARLSGQPPPKVTTISNGKPVKISLKQAIQDMGDRQGYYFPRIRESGEWKIEGRKAGVPNQMDFFASKALSKGYAQKLRRQGYNVESTHSGAFSEDLFQTLVPLLAQEQVVNSVIDRVSKNEDFDAVYADMFAKQYAEMLKSHGSRARMIGRSDAIGVDVKRGYETDPVKAIAIATEAAAGGYAKQQIAINAMKAITGRDLTWDKYQNDNPGKKHDDYLKDVRKRGADAARQQTEYKEATGTLKDILKNQEFADRIVGTLKGMAVVWYLGGRVSSAAVNTTNMVMGVPATIVGELSTKDNKVSFARAFGSIGKAMKAYGLFRIGKTKRTGESALFQEIEKRGWDAPQFNMEALNAIQSKYGKAWGKVIDLSMWMFGVTEKINRATSVAAGYMALCKTHNVKLQDSSGKLHEKFLLKARNASDVAHGVYGKENRPYHMRGDHVGARVLQMTYVFQTFTHNYLQEMARLGLVKKQYGAAAYMAVSGGVLGGLGATVPIGIAKAIAALFDTDDPEEEMIKWADDAFGGGKLARYGLPGLLGVSLKGSLAMRVGIPGTFVDIFGAPGNVVADIWSGTKNITKGFYREGLEQIAPVAVSNISRGLRESGEGVTTQKGSPVFFGDERLKGNTYDMMLRWLSFNPTGISEKREIQWNEYKVMNRYKERRSELYKRYKRFYFKPPGKRNVEDIINITADIRDFNTEVKRKKISRIVRPITKRSIKQSMRSLKPSKRERER